MSLSTRTVPVNELGIEFEILADDTIIGPAIASGAWEDHETRLFRSHVGRGSRVVDLGANVGWYAALAVMAGAEVVSFEPVPEIAAITERNIERAMAKGSGKGRVVRAAAGSEKGTAQLALNPTDNFGDNRVLDGDAPPEDLAGARTFEIAVERVDDHVEGPIDLLKVDTQGSEWLALQGARALLSSSPNLALLIEFWPYALRGAEPQALLAFLEHEGFQLGKATAAPYPMTADRILAQALARDPVKGGIDLYGTRGKAFHVLGVQARMRGAWRSMREA